MVTEGLLELGHCRVKVVVASIAGVSRLPLEATAPISGTLGLSSCRVHPFITLSQDQVNVEVFLGITSNFGSASMVHTGGDTGAFIMTVTESVSVCPSGPVPLIV